MSKLTRRQAAFVDEYLVDMNGAQAAIRAGYAARSARVTAARLLTNANIAAAVQQRCAERSERTGLTAARVLEELRRIGIADIRQLMSWSHDRVVFTPSGDLTEEQAAAVAAVKSKTITVTREDGSTEQRIEIELKLHDKIAALREAGRHLGIGDTLDITHHMEELTDAELTAIASGADPATVLAGRRKRR